MPVAGNSDGVLSPEPPQEQEIRRHPRYKGWQRANCRENGNLPSSVRNNRLLCGRGVRTRVGSTGVSPHSHSSKNGESGPEFLNFKLF